MVTVLVTERFARVFALDGAAVVAEIVPAPVVLLVTAQICAKVV